MADIDHKALAKLVSVTPAAVSRWEADLRKPRDAVLRKLATVLRVTPEYLVYGVVESPQGSGEGNPGFSIHDVTQRAADAGRGRTGMTKEK